MTDWQRKVRAGDPVRNSAAAYNAFIDAAIAHRNLAATGVTKVASRAGDYVLAENRGGTVAEAWYPVSLHTGLEEAVVRREARMVMAFGGDTAGISMRHAAACVGVPQEPIRPGAVGTVCVAGMTYAVCRKSASYPTRPGQRMTYSVSQVGVGDFVPAFVRDSRGAAIAFAPAKEIDADFEVRPVRIDGGNHVFSARITGATQESTGSARWEYDWEEVQFLGGAFWDTPVGGMTSAVDGKARNSLEAGNTTTTAYGGPVTGSDFQINETGVLFRPVPNGAVVQMWFEADPEEGLGIPIFQAPNAVYGPCTPLNGLT